MRAANIESRGKIPIQAGQLIVMQTGHMRPLDRLNAYRAANTLVGYVNPRPDVDGWPTNHSGINLYINGAGIVVNILDLEAPPTAIPRGHWVLSGHLQARLWLLEHAPVGTQIYAN